MRYLDKVKWTELKANLQTAFREGIVTLRKGSMVARKKASELTEEGIRHYKLIVLKTKMHNGLSDLGARVYLLMAAKGRKNFAADDKVKDITAQLKRYVAEIDAIEKKHGKIAKRRMGKAA